MHRIGIICSFAMLALCASEEAPRRDRRAGSSYLGGQDVCAEADIQLATTTTLPDPVGAGGWWHLHWWTAIGTVLTKFFEGHTFADLRHHFFSGIGWRSGFIWARSCSSSATSCTLCA